MNIFLPSRRILWKIKSHSKDKIYHVDNILQYCTCRGFYYNYQKGKCYHLEKISNCIKNQDYSVNIFEDKAIDNYLRKQVIKILEDE